MKIRVVSSTYLDRCPQRSLQPSHYRSDGTCRCVDTPASLAAEAEVAAALADLRAARARLAAARHTERQL